MRTDLSPPVRSVRVVLSRRGLRYRALPIVVGGQFIAIESAPLDALTDLSHQEFIDDLDAWTRRGRLQVTTVLIAIALATAAFALRLPAAACGAVGLFGLVAFMIARRIELRRRQYFLLFDLDESAEERFDAIGRAFEQLAASGILNSVRLEHIHGDWKRHAGATTTVHSDDAHIDRRHPRHVSSNLKPAPIRLRAQGLSLFFFPDRLLIEKDGRKAAVSYGALTLTCHNVNMRWFGSVPSDAETVGQSWRYVNKNGSPDRRFNNNYVVPILLLAEMGLSSRSGLEIVLQASATRAAAEVVEEIRSLGRFSSAVESSTIGDSGLPQRSLPGAGIDGPGDGTVDHRFESVRLLRATRTWRELSVSALFEAIGRDGQFREMNKAGLRAFLSDFRDLVVEFDECTRRTAIAGGAELTAKLAAPIGELRSNLLRALGSAMSNALSQIAPGEHEQLRNYLGILAGDPGKITSHRSEYLG